MTYTNGPWAVNPYYARVDCTQMGEDGDLTPVCQMPWPTELHSERETEANVHLIAAAPDLLEALERILSDEAVALSRPDYVFAHEAIAKARARGDGS